MQPWSNLLNENLYTISGFYNHSISRRVVILGRQGEAKLGNNEGEDNLQFNHGEVLAQAQARADPKRNVSLRALASFRDAPGEPLRFELVSIRSPYCRISM